MALVNRSPWGKPGNDERALMCPQAAAWLAALKHAREKVFIQTPTFSAAPVVDGVLAAVRRGIEVTLYVDVGFNDGGEALPLQGGTNEEVVRGMYAKLEEHEKERLKYFWFTGAWVCHTGADRLYLPSMSQPGIKANRSTHISSRGTVMYATFCGMLVVTDPPIVGQAHGCR